MNDRVSYSKRQNDRFPTQNISNPRNSYSNGNNLRYYHPYNYSTSYRSNYQYNSSNSYNDNHLYARNTPYAYPNRRYNNHARYHNNDFNRRDNFRHYDSMNSSTYKHVNTNSIWISKHLNVDERKKYIISHYMIGRQISLKFVFQTLIIRTLMKKWYQSILNIFQVPTFKEK